MAQYKVAVQTRAYDVMSDGKGGGRLYPWATCLGIGAGGLAAGLPGAAAGGAIGAIVDLFAGSGKPQPSAPVPVAAVVELEFTNVSPKRASWAEYLLCKWARRNHWAVRAASGQLIDERNAEYAERNARAPDPWTRKGKR
jgi:hypothetical protein